MNNPAHNNICHCSFKFEGNFEDCGVTVECDNCHYLHDVCRCKQNLVTIDDFGVLLCDSCFSNDKEAQAHCNKMADKEAFQFGYVTDYDLETI